MITVFCIDTDTNEPIISKDFKSNSTEEAINYAMKILFDDLGNGGMSAKKKDGSIGSLWRCADEIYDCLRSGGKYFYDNRKFYITGLDLNEKED